MSAPAPQPLPQRLREHVGMTSWENSGLLAEAAIALDAAAERERVLQEALRLACNDAWSDSDGAMRHYLEDAAAVLGGGDSEPGGEE